MIILITDGDFAYSISFAITFSFICPCNDYILYTVSSQFCAWYIVYDFNMNERLDLIYLTEYVYYMKSTKKGPFPILLNETNQFAAV